MAKGFLSALVESNNDDLTILMVGLEQMIDCEEEEYSSEYITFVLSEMLSTVRRAAERNIALMRLTTLDLEGEDNNV